MATRERNGRCVRQSISRILSRCKAVPVVVVQTAVPLLRLLVLTASCAYALDPGKAITQYTQDFWGTDAGLPNSTVTSIAQTANGYLWLGTEEGLARFDGVRFVTFDKKNTPELQSNHISTLLADSQRNLWIGTQGGGLTRLRDGHFRTYTARDGLANDVVLSLYEDAKARLWIGTNGGGLQCLRDGAFTTYGVKDGLPDQAVFTMAGSSDGSLWIGTHAGLARLRHGRFETYTKAQGLGDNYIRSLCVTRAGELWIGTNQGGISTFVGGKFTTYPHLRELNGQTIWSIYEDHTGAIWIGTNDEGVTLYRDGRFTSYSVKNGLPVSTVMGFLEDRENNLWLGTLGGGLVRLKDGPFTVFTTREGLSNDTILPVLEDRNGSTWVGTHGGGVNRLKDGKVVTYTTTDGLSDNVVLALAEGRDGSLWIATRKQLDRLKDGRIIHYTSKDGLPNSIVLCLYTDEDGILWAGTRAGLVRFDGRHFLTYTVENGLSNDYVLSVYKDRQKRVWIGTGGGGLNKFENGQFSSVTTADGLSSNVVWSVCADPDGTLWIGTGGGGLNRLRNGKLTPYTVRTGLFDDEVFEVLSDRYGYLWMTSNKGVFRVSKAELNAYAEGHASQITSTAYGTADGLKNKECNGGFQPAGWQTRDGRLLFPTMKGLASVDPARLGRNKLPPPVIIEQVMIDGSNFDIDSSIKAKPGQGRLQFEFTAPSLITPEKIRFKYKLDGFDKDWNDSGTRRTAYYTNIPPGEYRFAVIARNNEGIWNEAGASIALTISPHLYETRLFLALCIGLAGMLGFGTYRFRIGQLRLNEKKLTQLVHQRTEALQNEVNAKERARSELAEAQQHLLELSRLSGMAEVASGVLHNVGNVLNSVNVGATIISSKLRGLRLENVTASVQMLQEHADSLSEFVTTDVKGKRVLPYLAKLAPLLEGERQQIVSEIEGLTKHIDHIKQIVATQQDYAKVSDVNESLSLPDLLEEALAMVEASLGRHHVEILREIEAVPEIPAPRHKVLQILVNLLRNAKQAVIEGESQRRQIRICTRLAGDKVRVEIHDTGVGIAPENLTRIFAHGFTTKPNGHGFGLHSGALAARQMHGSLCAQSDGLGHGAAFILELPLNAVTAPELAIK